MDLIAATGAGEYVVFDFWEFLSIILAIIFGIASICLTVGGSCWWFSMKVLTRLTSIDEKLATGIEGDKARDVRIERSADDIMEIKLNCKQQHPTVCAEPSG